MEGIRLLLAFFGVIVIGGLAMTVVQASLSLIAYCQGVKRSRGMWIRGIFLGGWLVLANGLTLLFFKKGSLIENMSPGSRAKFGLS